MGEKLDKPIINKNPKDGKNNIFRYGMNKIQGWKQSMDVFNLKEIEIDKDKNINILGLFDGHSGKEISQYLSENFSNELSKNNNFIKGDYKQALIDSFKNIDLSLKTEEINNKLNILSQKNKTEKMQNLYTSVDNKNNLNKNDIDDLNIIMDVLDPNNIKEVFISDYMGSSGIVVLISDNITYVANAGNSHCIVINKNLSIIKNKTIIEQNIYNSEEKKRVKIAKGIKYGKEKEKKYEKEEYLYTRGFGDFKYKNNNLIDIEAQEILCKPDILEISNNDLKFLIICNSGFFESANIFSQNNNNENIEKNVANYFINNLKNDKKLISDVIGEYFDYYITNEINKNQNDNENNLSCIIIDFVNN